MSPRSVDPYKALGVDPGASDAELRSAYRRLVQLHHPDHNGGSPESAQAFEQVQEAYAAVQRLRASGRASAGAQRASAGGRQGTSAGGRQGTSAEGGAPRASAADVDERIAAMESELRDARAAGEKARRAARERAQREPQTIRDAARQAVRDAGRNPANPGGAGARKGRPGRASDEELGYVSTDDSFGKILDDARAEFASRWDEAAKESATERVAGLLDGLAARLKGDRPK
jgi:curved DNA-binding protein CbpA